MLMKLIFIHYFWNVMMEFIFMTQESDPTESLVRRGCPRSMNNECHGVARQSGVCCDHHNMSAQWREYIDMERK